jgi:hypothetical protein
MMIDWLIFKLIIFFMFEQLFSLFILSITKLDEKILNKLFKKKEILDDHFSYHFR